jgi:hypothetical protein
MTVPAVASPMPSGGKGIARGKHTEQEKRNNSDRLFFHGSQHRKKTLPILRPVSDGGDSGK